MRMGVCICTCTLCNLTLASLGLQNTWKRKEQPHKPFASFEADLIKTCRLFNKTFLFYQLSIILFLFKMRFNWKISCNFVILPGNEKNQNTNPLHHSRHTLLKLQQCTVLEKLFYCNQLFSGRKFKKKWGRKCCREKFLILKRKILTCRKIFENPSQLLYKRLDRRLFRQAPI